MAPSIASQETFFSRSLLRNGDYQAYIELMAEWCEGEGVEIWAYCLMPNHIHLTPGKATRHRSRT